MTVLTVTYLITAAAILTALCLGIRANRAAANIKYYIEVTTESKPTNAKTFVVTTRLRKALAMSNNYILTDNGNARLRLTINDVADKSDTIVMHLDKISNNGAKPAPCTFLSTNVRCIDEFPDMLKTALEYTL